MPSTFYWYDLETTGIDPFRDRVVQFAGIRTNEQLEPIAEPQNFYCRLAADVLPNPEACLVTGITPQQANREGLCEADFIARIHAEFSQPGTCVVGYNNLRFDDEFTRNLLYRNFFDPYAREWQAGNSRWDLIDVVRLTEALRPEGICWPQREDGAPSFKLEHLTVANGISHFDAHDALSDVHATIEMAKLLKRAHPKLFDWALGFRDKNKASELLRPSQQQLWVHVSGKYPALRHSTAIILPLAPHPVNRNGIIVYDASIDPRPLLEMTVEAIRDNIYTAADQLPEGQPRIPLKVVHINKSPMLAPLNTLNDDLCQRLQIDLAQCEANRQQLLAPGVADKVQSVFEVTNREPVSNPDLMLYQGGFFSSEDRQRMNRIKGAEPTELAQMAWNFDDTRLPEMLFRYRARNYPETLDQQEQQKWRQQCLQRLTLPDAGGSLTLDDYFERLDALVVAQNLNPDQEQMVELLIEYGEQLADSVADV